MSMLSVPTLFVVFVVNFLAIGLVWSYVARSYPNFEAARYWCAMALIAALGAGISLMRGAVDPVVPILLGNGLIIFACCTGMMGIKRFYGKAISWLPAIVITGTSVACLAFFKIWHDDIVARIVIYSTGQTLPLVLSLRDLLARENRPVTPGARMAVSITVLIALVHGVRSLAAVFEIGGPVALIEFNQFQAAMIVLLVFSAMSWNFGFMLMAIDRLRAEVANLAMFDDLTGAANRRQLLARFEEECARSDRTMQPFAVLVIDLDGFKEINDGYGHAAGDECLRMFTRAAQTRLRTGDLLARIGGDEFCVVLPSTTLREAAIVARQIVETCRDECAQWNSIPISLSASVGVAQWRPEIGHYADRLIAEADQALYIAKKDGKNGYAIHQDLQPLAPTEAEKPFLKTA
jgi:diguanylate cyclase (GGDEF)-like protein